jgi:hypothetical protein
MEDCVTYALACDEGAGDHGAVGAIPAVHPGPGL